MKMKGKKREEETRAVFGLALIGLNVTVLNFVEGKTIKKRKKEVKWLNMGLKDLVKFNWIKVSLASSRAPPREKPNKK